jgi:hypothetical protein
MVELCNELDCDAWFTMPAGASDDFVRRFAELIEQQLEDGLKVYVDDAVEELDPDSPLFALAVERGSALAPGSADVVAAAKHHAARSQQVFTIWRDDAHMVVGVLTLPGDDRDTAARVLEQTSAVESADMIAIAGGIGGPDFTHELALIANGLTVDRTIAMLNEHRAERMLSFAEVAEMVRATGKPMAVASAGAGLLTNADGFDKQLIKLLRKAEFDPRIISLNRSEEEFWANAGATLILADDRPAGAP